MIREEKEKEAEIEARKLNVIIYSFPESEKNTMEDRRNDDLEKVQSVLTDNLHLGVEVESVVRLGTSARDRNRPRPVRFTVRDFETKRKVLNASKRLKNHENYSNVYFSPDLTRNQRKAASELREERRRRLAQGEENLIIRRGRIITQGRLRSENDEPLQRDHDYLGTPGNGRAGRPVISGRRSRSGSPPRSQGGAAFQ